MSSLISRLSRLHHLSDEAISRLISGEMPTVRSFRARAHIEKCWQCRLRREAFERAAMKVTEHRNHMAGGMRPNPERRALLLAELRKCGEHSVRQPMWTRSVSHFRAWIGNQMSPVLASALIVVTATFLLAWVWQRSVDRVTASQLMQRAEASDGSLAQEKKPGVVYQKIRITTPHGSVERELYRDLRGNRRRRAEPVKAELQPVQQLLSSAGVDWDSPLSAASYQEWHDRQFSVRDEVQKEDGDRLKLVSKIPNDWIEEESLTVRASDFHPIERTIETRSRGTIEIAELNYAVLDWNGVNKALFEPLLTVPARLHPLAILPALPSEAELDSAELSARLALNKLQADEGEQISVSRTDRAVEVKGVVETGERKRELLKALWPLPHVKTEVLSISELQALPRDTAGAPSLKMQSVDVQPSPLEEYLNTQSGRKTELASDSERLLDAALKVRQNAGELSALEKRFPSLEGAGGANDSAYSQLKQSYLERLAAGLDEENSTLDAIGFEQHQQPAPDATGFDLAAEVDYNETLCRELIAGNSGTARPASEIVREIYESVARIRLAMATLPGSPQ
jgi:hypothetical protein